MRTDSLISGEKRRRLFGLIVLAPTRSLGVRELARELNVSPAFVSGYFKALARKGLLTRDGKPDFSSPLLRGLKLLYNIELLWPLANAISKNRLVLGIGVYGSWAFGTNTGESDLDLWVKAKRPLSLAETAKLKLEADGFSSSDVSFLILEREKLQSLKKASPPFYYALANSFLLSGEPLDIV